MSPIRQHLWKLKLRVLILHPECFSFHLGAASKPNRRLTGGWVLKPSLTLLHSVEVILNVITNSNTSTVVNKTVVFIYGIFGDFLSTARGSNFLVSNFYFRYVHSYLTSTSRLPQRKRLQLFQYEMPSLSQNSYLTNILLKNLTTGEGVVATKISINNSV